MISDDDCVFCGGSGGVATGFAGSAGVDVGLVSLAIFFTAAASVSNAHNGLPTVIVAPSAP